MQEHELEPGLLPHEPLGKAFTWASEKNGGP
jgi:hypothetical protein